jgi:DNA helicase-2/ATP-dependent DNA helicase PcrA
MRLTDEQRGAIMEPGHVCLVSCPGSGKTRVIVAKLLHCIEVVNGTTRRVACITHTNPAADEIDARLRQICFGDEDRYYEIATIHGFALQNVLRPFHHLLPEFRKGFTILTSVADAYSEKVNELVRRYGLKRDVLESFERIERAPDGTALPVDGLPEELQQEWCLWLDENAYVTLNEIVFHAGRLVSSYGHIASALASRFAWVLVDEFQDSSPGQVLLLKAIHEFKRTTFFCVGDPNQSIYRFAGASPGLLVEFADEIHANKSHRLTGNFRSSAHICAYAEKLCASDPPMHAVGDYANCSIVPSHHTVPTTTDGIFEYFLPAVTALNVPLGDVAILAPSWFPLFHLARELRKRNIPAVGPGARPYRRSHIVTQLLEPIGAYLESREPAIAIAVQRALFLFIANLTGHALYSIFDYKGRVVVCKLLAEAAAARDASAYAVDWITSAVELFSGVLLDAEMLPAEAIPVLKLSAAEMVIDIRSREGGSILTVEDLGIFARPKHCVQLLTVHRAKGREFEAVAVIDAHDGRFPHYSVYKLRDDAERDAQVQESKRVFYVATTRAKRLLMFFTDKTHYNNRPTPFLMKMGL